MSKSIKFLLCCMILMGLAGQAQAVSNQATPLVATEANTLIEGTVVETLSAGGSTYVGIENEGRIIWAVTRRASVLVGEEVVVASGSVKTNFTSESLGRTFDTIIFTNHIAKR